MEFGAREKMSLGGARASVSTPLSDLVRETEQSCSIGTRAGIDLKGIEINSPQNAD